MGELNLCFGCMEAKTGDSICPYCGFDESSAPTPEAMPLGTMLHDRYLVGNVIEHNGEGMTYLAYDTTIGCKVIIREYLPVQLCNRVENSALVNVNYNHLAQYKSLMAEYTELNKALARQRSLVHLNPALDLFGANNTTYAVYEYLEGRNLLEYLKENAGELSWRTVSRMFPPLFTTLSILHNAGVLHRGISPETIFITDKCDIKLGGFCISAVRTNDTELDAELFDGYAAPEQYFANRQQGSWTDVYGICAVLYRILTGCRATDANTRQNYDNLVPPCELNSRIPQHVSDAIMKGLALDGNARVRTITDLVTLLFESGEEETVPEPVYKNATTTFRTVPAGSPQTPQRTAAPKKASSGQPSSSHKSTKTSEHSRNTSSASHKKAAPAEVSILDKMDKLRVPLLIAILILVIFGIVLIAFQENFRDNPEGNSLADNSSAADSFEAVQTGVTTSADRIDAYMPALVGMNYQIKKDQMAGWLELETEYEYNDDFPKDIIFYQEIPENTGFVAGSSVKVKVSLGSASKPLPDFKGYKLQAYLGRLEEMGFVPAVEVNPHQAKQMGTTTVTSTIPTASYGDDSEEQQIFYCAKVDNNYQNGYVCAVEPEVGTHIDVRKGYKIIIYYADNPDIPINRVTTTGKSTTTKSKTTTTKTNTTAAVTQTTKAPVTTAPNTTAPPVVTTAPPTEPPKTEPPQTDPPQTDPPQTDPPQTDPPKTDPPQTQAPAEE